MFASAAGLLFQFHFGTIKRLKWAGISFLSSYFNSTLVRLKGLCFTIILIPLPEFQFHFGTIKSEQDHEDSHRGYMISIPLWYD